MARRHIYSLLALILRSCLITTALIAGTQSSRAQTGPGNCAIDTVVGNIGGGLTCLTAPVISTLGFASAAANGINDQSAVSGSAASFWPSNGPAIVHRMNRLMVGVAASGNLSPGGNTWLDALIGNTSELANITVLGTMFSGINAASRTSDTNAVFTPPSNGSAGAYLFGYNDDTTQGNIALGANAVGIAKAGTKGIVLGGQWDINTAATPGCVTSPASTLCATGSTAIGLLVTPGAFSSLATQNPNAAIVMQAGGGAGIFTKGIMFASGVLSGAQGNGGRGIAMEMMPGMTLSWYDGSTRWAELGTVSGGTFGITTNSSQWSINGVATVSCSGVTAASVVVTNGIVTHC